jgi:hypothetical protein
MGAIGASASAGPWTAALSNLGASSHVQPASASTHAPTSAFEAVLGLNHTQATPASQHKFTGVKLDSHKVPAPGFAGSLSQNAVHATDGDAHGTVVTRGTAPIGTMAAPNTPSQPAASVADAPAAAAPAAPTPVAPAPAHAAPAPAHAAPVPAHAAPVPAHAAPVPAHAAPVPVHAAPVPVHAAPVPAHVTSSPAPAAPAHAAPAHAPAPAAPAHAAHAAHAHHASAHPAPAKHVPAKHVPAKPAPAPRPRPTSPFQIYDSVTPGGIPHGHQVATYANGAYAAPASDVAGRGRVLWIDTNGSDTHADVLDVEPGDASPAGAALWVKAKLSADPHSVAIVYTMISQWQAVRDDVAALPQSMQSHVRYWIADPTGIPHVLPGSNATQWYWGNSYDITSANPGFES